MARPSAALSGRRGVGGDFLTGPTVGSWYAQPVSGALLGATPLFLLAAVCLAGHAAGRPASLPASARHADAERDR